jgi:hypothetical protein
VRQLRPVPGAGWVTCLQEEDSWVSLMLRGSVIEMLLAVVWSATQLEAYQLGAGVCVSIEQL